jgi:SAM-dependent methyltransferase
MESGLYGSDYHLALRDGARRSAEVIVPLVLRLWPARSVIDVGCGLGAWLAVFREHGVEDVLGVDGDYVDRAALAIPPGRFAAVDLEQPLALGRTFDLVASLEVAEHLPPGRAATFVESLTRLGPAVLFSAAAPHQGGEHHVNERWPAYWAGLFAERGFAAVDCLRRRVWADERVEWWYAQNAVLYVERGRLSASPALRAECERDAGPPLSLVHPKRFLEWVEWGLGQSQALEEAWAGARKRGES